MLISIKPKQLFADKHSFIALGLFIIIVSFWYIGRELRAPGYLEAVWMNELGGRYFEPIEGHRSNAFVYITTLWSMQSWTIILAGISLAVSILLSSKGTLRYILFIASSILFYVLMMSMAKTTIWWYIIPILPLLAVMIGSLGQLISTFTKERLSQTQGLFATALLFVFCLSVPYVMTIERIEKRNDQLYQTIEFQLGTHLREMTKVEKLSELLEYPQKVLYEIDYYSKAFINFYQRQLSERGVEIDYTPTIDDLKGGDYVLVTGLSAFERVQQRYETTHENIPDTHLWHVHILGPKAQ